MSAPWALSKFHKHETASNEKLLAVRNTLAGYETISEEDHKQQQTETKALFYLNPNTASKQDWIALGINETLAQRIINYTTKGGKFYEKTDLLKIYGFAQDDFERLSPYVIFHAEKIAHDTKHTFSVPEQGIPAPFNPNTITKEQWMQLGINQYVAQRIINYISKGGTYNKPEDLLNTYGFLQQDLERLKTYMVFDNETSEHYSEQTMQNPVTAEKQITEINTATKELLLALGFSNNNASSILTYRESLGGFYSIQQLYDVYNVDLEVLENAKEFIQVDATKIQTIKLNTASFEELEKHAYISKSAAMAIIDYRTENGNFIVLSELKKVRGMYPELYEKLKPYIQL
jgi:competence ComEA-like helix-hairpin-helix protein